MSKNEIYNEYKKFYKAKLEAKGIIEYYEGLLDRVKDNEQSNKLKSEINTLRDGLKNCDLVLETLKSKILDSSLLKDRALLKIRSLENDITIDFQDSMIKDSINEMYKGKNTIQNSILEYQENVEKYRRQISDLIKSGVDESSETIIELKDEIELSKSRIVKLEDMDTELRSKLKQLYGEKEAAEMVEQSVNKLDSFRR